jgi:hypothetical protein
MKIILLLALLSGCATSNVISKEECLNSNWERVGFRDGARGEAPAFLDQHIYSCQDTAHPVDQAAYQAGRERGLKQYCTEAALYDAGQMGRPYHGVCDRALEVHWQNGHERFLLNGERREAERVLSKREQELSDDHSVVGDISKGYHAITGQSQTQIEQDRINNVNDRLYKNQKLAPPGAKIESDDEIALSFMKSIKPVVAGFVGGVVGFGTGHVIMGSYLDSGWKFTALDAAAFAGLFVVSHNCPGTTEASTGREVASTNQGCGLATSATIISLIGIRIWEGISAARSGPHVTVSAIPLRDTVGLGAVASF